MDGSEISSDEPKKNGFRYICEPVLFLYSFAYMLQFPTAHQYIYSRFSENIGFKYSYNNPHAGISRECHHGSMNQTDIHAQQKVQSATAHFQIYYHIMSIIPSTIMNLFYGALSDEVGRRCMMTVVLICSVIESSILLVNIVFKLPLWTIFIGNACAGFGGGLNGMFMLIIAYTADVTEKMDRSVRIGYIEAALFLGMTISNYASGELIHQYGFTIPQVVTVLSHLSAILYVAFVLKKSRDQNKPRNETNKLLIFWQQPINMWNILVKERANKDLLYLAIFILISGLTFTVSVHSVFTLYLLNRPFCWLARDVGYIMGTYFLLLSLGTAIGMKILTPTIPEWLLSLLSFMMSAGSFLYIAFATNKLDLYAAIALRFFGGLPTAIFRGNVSKSVPQNEHGAIFSVITSIEMLLIMLGIFIFNTSYAHLNDIGHPGWFFLIPAIMLIIPFTLSVVYWKKTFDLQRKHFYDVTISEEDEEEEKEQLLKE
eukprot:TCONS_00069901-protein